jgi:uncharacterized protein DUF2513
MNSRRRLNSTFRLLLHGRRLMKRDMDLVREILIAIENALFDGGPLQLTPPENYSPDQVAYHIMLLHQAGLIYGFDFSTDVAPDWRPGYLTWEGHEFLNAARDGGRWARAKALVLEKRGGLMFEVLKQALVYEMKKRVFGAGATAT